jgi:hypothetical protein
MIPLASASGPAIIGLVVVAAGLFLSWLLRTETGRDPPEEAAPGGVPAGVGPAGVGPASVGPASAMPTGADPAAAAPGAAEPDAQPTVTSQPSE